MNWLYEWAKIEVISFYIGIGVLSVLVVLIAIYGIKIIIDKHKKDKDK